MAWSHHQRWLRIATMVVSAWAEMIQFPTSVLKWGFKVSVSSHHQAPLDCRVMCNRQVEPVSAGRRCGLQLNRLQWGNYKENVGVQRCRWVGMSGAWIRHGRETVPFWYARGPVTRVNCPSCFKTKQLERMQSSISPSVVATFEMLNLPTAARPTGATWRDTWRVQSAQRSLSNNTRRLLQSGLLKWSPSPLLWVVIDWLKDLKLMLMIKCLFSKSMNLHNEFIFFWLWHFYLSVLMGFSKIYIKTRQ